ncbi:MAG: cobalamin biosynthesis protein [Eubacterium sp.]|nr:cobalamin biosynthesis protein [Eubacterium sp.]
MKETGSGEGNLRIICFTGKGYLLGKMLAEKMSAGLYVKCRDDAEMTSAIHVDRPLSDWTHEVFVAGDPVLFIGAAGIAVRAIAPSVRDKLTDVPILVMDMEGRFVIPILSGHYGGANRLAEKIADMTGATPVITTGTDIVGAFAADIFAKENNLEIRNPHVLPVISGKAVRGEELLFRSKLPIPCNWQGKEPCGVRILQPEDDEKEDICLTVGLDTPSAEDTLYLTPRILHIGIGCKKDISFEALYAFMMELLSEKGLDREAVAGLSSIDRKKDEKAILRLANDLGVPFRTFTPEELLEVEGTFPQSAFVEEKVGVGNVSARAAAADAGEGYLLLENTRKKDGMTLAVAIPREFPIRG